MRDRFALQYKADVHRRMIGGKETIIHCHHYNARLQHTIEHVTEVDGAKIIRDSAEAVFAEHVAHVIEASDDEATRLEVVAALYAHLGFGRLDVSRAKDGLVTADQSHYVEGWRAGFAQTTRKACTFTEGYLQGALAAATGQTFTVREHKCLNAGDPACEFRVEARTEPLLTVAKRPPDFTPAPPDAVPAAPSNIDEPAIIDALVQMPFMGSDEGLIPAFGVYLALTPADFYNLMCIQFVEQMRAKGLFRTARRLLTFAGETCAMNTFRGIMASAEWDALIVPMIEHQRDELFGLIALSNGFGWGNWRVTAHTPQALTVESLNGYEAIGYREYRGVCDSPQCFMLCGVAAGMMELIYGEGMIEERFGTYLGEESHCICSSEPRCRFDVEAT